jgi:hypothetical protein
VEKIDDNKRVVYSLCIEDIQTVAQEEYGRKLSANELVAIEEKLGDYIPWYDMIDSVINNYLRPFPISE